ncbi:acyltransferase [Dyella sp. RRB7]|uniref:acyltransferase family protein n=1 Tax=Dyella sp. RRB7 TaxID=2919502 RepID=UPI001FA95C3E|nr:acyltransferase [Dyella sp. RRB7]
MSALDLTRQSGQRNLEIEVLRALAVIGVAVHHLQGVLFQPGLQSLTALFHYADFWWGVDLFFAISGFVIARGLLPQLGGERGAGRYWPSWIGAFWIRRFLRLLPSAWLWLTLTLLAVFLFNKTGVFGSVEANLKATLAGVLNIANFRLADAMFRYEYGASFVYWSLSLEEQFYLVLPVLLLVLRRHVAWLLVAVFVAQALIFRSVFWMTMRTDALALGVLIAMLEQGRIWIVVDPRWVARFPVSRTMAVLLPLAGMCVFASGWMEKWPYRVSSIAMLAAWLVWMASYASGYVMGDGYPRRWLAWIGARSYAIYLIHVPVYFGMREATQRLIDAGVIHRWPPSWLSLLIALVLIGLLAELNYQWVEQPLRAYGRRLADAFECWCKGHDGRARDEQASRLGSVASSP